MQNVVDVILLAGEVLLTSGAEIHRVEETIERMGRAAGFVEVSICHANRFVYIAPIQPKDRCFLRVRRIQRQ